MKRVIGMFVTLVLLWGIIFVQIPGIANDNTDYGSRIWEPNLVDCVGSDGLKYTKSKDYWILFYNEQGGGWFWHAEGGETVKKLRIQCDDGTLQTVYCVGTGLPYYDGGEKYAKEDPDITDEYFGRLPASAQQGIYLTLLFGYEDGLTSPISGTNEDDFWLATQVLVWEYHQGLREGASPRKSNGQIGADVYYNIIRKRPAELCYNWIVSQIQQYLAFPSFVQSNPDIRNSGNVLVQHEKDGVYTLELYDENCTGAQMEVLNEIGQEISWMDISYLGTYRYRLQSSRPINGTFTLSVRKKVHQGYKKLLFFSDGTNDTQVVACRSTQAYSPKEVRYMQVQTEDYVEKGTIQITKYTQGGDVSGFTFYISGISHTNGNFSQTVVTDAQGQATLKDIPVGLYEIREILPEDSPWQTPSVQQTTVVDRFVSSVVFNNELKKGSLSIIKTFEGRKTPWKGVSFEIVGQYQGREVYRQKAETDSNGGILLPDIPIGQYTVTELPGEQSDLYTISEPVSVEVGASETGMVQIHNMAVRGQIEIEKIGPVMVSVENTGDCYVPIYEKRSLNGAVFEIYAAEDICGEDGTVRILKDTLVERIGEAQGQYLSTPLYPGSYRIEETVSPDGYCLSESSVSVTVAPGTISRVEIENSPVNNQVRFTKILENGDRELYEQVWFGLYAQDAIFAPDGSYVPKDGLVCAVPVWQDGTVRMETLLSGEFYVREIQTASGYIIDENLYHVSNGTINSGQPIVNYKISANPKTGAGEIPTVLFGLMVMATCIFCRVAFYTKSRYNE